MSENKCPFALPVACHIVADSHSPIRCRLFDANGNNIVDGYVKNSAESAEILGAIVEAINGYYGDEEKKEKEQEECKTPLPKFNLPRVEIVNNIVRQITGGIADYLLKAQRNDRGVWKENNIGNIVANVLEGYAIKEVDLCKEEEKPIATKIIDSLEEFSDALKNDESIQEKFRCISFKSSNALETIDEKLRQINDKLESIVEAANKHGINEIPTATVISVQSLYHIELAKLKQRNEELEKERDELKRQLDERNDEKPKQEEKGEWKFFRNYVNCMLKRSDDTHAEAMYKSWSSWQESYVTREDAYITEPEAREFTKDWTNYEIVWGETREAYEQRMKGAEVESPEINEAPIRLRVCSMCGTQLDHNSPPTNYCNDCKSRMKGANDE